MDELIAVRVKDGIFAGNRGAAADKTFLIMNKITHVINCAGAEVGDFFSGEPGFSYLSFPWKDAAGSVCTTILFDAADGNITRAVNFIDEALAVGECVLVHSVYGKSRSPALIAAYLIIKYGWKLESALAYINMAHPDAEIKPHFQRQLRQFAKRHAADRDIFALDVDDSHFGLDNDQWMLRNTLLNGLLYDSQMSNPLYKQCTEKVDVGAPVNTKTTTARPRITFVDTKKNTDVESKVTCPVVNPTTPFHADPASTDPSSFIGLRGTSSLRTPRRSPSILSRSTSPCERRLESDPRSCPKGRQTLVVVHSGTMETATSSTTGKLERPPALHSNAPASRSHSSSSHLNERERPKAREVETDAFLSQPRQSSQESTRSIDYSRLAPPSQVRSPFATLASSHKYRIGSPLPMPKEKSATTTAKGSRMKVSSSPSARPPVNTGPSPVAPPATSAAVRLAAQHSASTNNSYTTNNATTSTTATTSTSSPTASRAAAQRTGSPHASNTPSREVVMGRPVTAAYRGIAPSRSAVNPRALDPNAVVFSANPRTSSRTSSPSQMMKNAEGGSVNGFESRSGSRRRMLSPVQSPSSRNDPNGRRRGHREERRPVRTRSPKTHKNRDTASTARSLNESFSSQDNNSNLNNHGGAASKNPATVQRQLPPAIASGRK
ncbi:putative dual specificity protein phosphatase [Leptomonas pyrrhocoris]|uniref:Putative dual specificity protein phosphatase n=1 Tax=Leptomonas pyrrhocoris TaxID=157538 RepID=A0A0N0DU08_LEPPY|nr:putative dual specificity protein phosphatase [Leptomonas pyrrhocoris]KPA78198.1 putative dual specificity protein phosphatase [Leptomonas pyrrhocoris]|eukprot:XP_015656637.1 putative dual specificity protein phosphatase [Leptomonas pyrrhocoris]